MRAKSLVAALLVAAAFTGVSGRAQEITPVIQVDNPPNTAAQQAKHYVVLVSLDGFRWDYPTKYGAPHLQSMAVDGASAPDGMLPSYPSLTFPNHLSLVTGLYPEHHGIVGNSFFDPTRNATYVYTQPKTSGDGTWYKGTPLWSLAEEQGMRSACLFWPGSEAEIDGKRPSYYLKYDDKLDDAKRVQQVLAWLNLPAKLRPHFITLYYSNVDHAGHGYGPGSDEVRAAVHHVDDMIGDLQAGLAASKLPVDLVVVADHGMVTLKGDPIDLSAVANLSGVHTEGSFIYAKDAVEAQKIFDEFETHPDPRFNVYHRIAVPSALHFDSNPREGNPVIVPNGPYVLRTSPAPADTAAKGTLRGGHGFDPLVMPEMKAIFFASGPDIRPDIQLPPFKNIDIYPFVAQLLGLNAPIADGRIKTLIPTLVNPPASLPGPFDEDGIATPPRTIKMVDAQFTDEARQAKINGSVRVSFVVERDGRPSHIQVIKGLGYGLDEEAIKAVQGYRFQPAMREGEPFAVLVNADIAYHIYSNLEKH